MKTKFTPGPWQISELRHPKRPHDMAMIATGAGKQCIDCTNSGDTPDEDNGNASLIAAAPELWEFARECAMNYDCECKFNRARCRACNAKALLSKVEGAE